MCADWKLGHRAEGEAEIIMAASELDIYTAPEFRDMVAGLIGQGRCKLVVSLERTEFVDAKGLGVLVGALKSARAHDGWLSVACTHELTLRAFRTIGVTELLGVQGSVEEVLAAHSTGPGAADSPP